MQTYFSTKQASFSGQHLHECAKPGCWFCYYISREPTCIIPSHTISKFSKGTPYVYNSARLVVGKDGKLITTRQMADQIGYSLGHVYNILNGWAVNKTNFKYLK